MREECAWQADARSIAGLFNDAGVLARRCEAVQLTPQSVTSLSQPGHGAIREMTRVSREDRRIIIVEALRLADDGCDRLPGPALAVWPSYWPG